MATPIPTNHAAFTLDEIVRATGGEVRSAFVPAAVRAASVSTDTRTIEPGAAFVALRAGASDGHAYVGRAIEAGASVLVVERDVAAPAGVAVVRVGSALRALGDLGRAHARSWRAGGGAVVAITGSAGKTTTRVAIAALLEHVRPGAVHGARGNLNNLIGLPLTLLGLEAQHRYAIVECGTNAPGEIAALASIAEPDVAVVTLVAAAHCEGLGSVDEVAHEKGALFRALRADGVAVGNADDARVMTALASAPAERRLSYGTADRADVRIVERTPIGFSRARLGLAIRGTAPGRRGERPRSVVIETPLIGIAGALASAAGVAAVETMTGEPLDAGVATAALSAADVGAGAGRLVPKLCASGLVVIDDSYNANPASAIASIRAAAELARGGGRRLVIVLGEMRELGPESARGHDEVGDEAAASGAARVLAIGGDARRIAARAAQAGAEASFSDDAAAGAQLARGVVEPADVVLVKGSRGVATEQVVRALGEAHGGFVPAGEDGP